MQYSYYGTGVSAGGGLAAQSCSSGTYGLGYPTLNVDPAGKMRQTWADAFGRLIEVDEPDPSTGSLTSGSPASTCYKYDLLGNLIEVDQGAQSRTFAYDALSRLTSETTPEAGIVNYYYTTSGGTLCAGDPKALCRATDARGITTTLTYDAENRLTSKSYSNGEPTVNYYYDQTSYFGPITNGKGRRTGMSDASGQSAWSYDANGNLASVVRSTAGQTKTVSYTYSYNGMLQSITYPSGLQVQYGYDAAGRPISAQCISTACSNVFFVDNATYAPQGALASVVLGCGSWPPCAGGVVASSSYNNRLQPASAVDRNGSTSLLSYTYSFLNGGMNNGNVISVTNNLVTGRGQSYTYDFLNRLATAQSQAMTGSDCWGQSYFYDRYANLMAISVTKCYAPALNLGIYGTNNQVSGFGYDASGHVLNDGKMAYTWNRGPQHILMCWAGSAEGRMATAGAWA